LLPKIIKVTPVIAAAKHIVIVRRFNVASIQITTLFLELQLWNVINIKNEKMTNVKCQVRTFRYERRNRKVTLLKTENDGIRM